MRFWKSETIRGRPCFSETLGSQLRRDLALEMSGFLMCGSSAVLGLNSTDAPGSIVSFTTCSKKKYSIMIPGWDIGDRKPWYSERRMDSKFQCQGQTCASSSIVNSPGFPKLKGPIWSLSIRVTNPSTYKFIDM